MIQVLEDIETTGFKNEKLVLKSDQETAVADVMRNIAKERKSNFGIALEQSAVGESDTNATIERAIQDFEGQARTLRVALEWRVQQKVPLSSPVMPWLIRHAAALITRCRIRPSGRTSLEIMKGRKSNVQITEFGEVVMFKIPKTKLTPGKFEAHWSSGVYMGFDMRTMESVLGTPSGVFKVSDVRRKPLQERWSADQLAQMSGSPKQTVPGQAYRRIPAYSKKFSSDRPEGEYVEQPTPSMPITRNWKFYKRDIDEHGPTEGCPGCRAIIKGLSTRAAHTPECRIRLQSLLTELKKAKVELTEQLKGPLAKMLSHRCPVVSKEEEKESPQLFQIRRRRTSRATSRKSPTTAASSRHSTRTVR